MEDMTAEMEGWNMEYGGGREREGDRDYMIANCVDRYGLG